MTIALLRSTDSDFTPFSDNINVPVSLTPGQSFNVGPIFILSDSFQENTERFVLNADSTSPLVAFQQFGEQADVNIVDNDSKNTPINNIIISCKSNCYLHFCI